MIVVSLLCGLAHSWKCDHDILQKSIKVNRPPQVESSAKLMVGERQPIRVKFDTTYIDSANPEGLETCQSANDKITWGGYTYTCTDGDLWTAEKQKVIKDTFANIQNFLESTLKVDRVTGILDIGETIGYPFPSTTAKDTDLYITLYPRPFGESSSTLASAAYTQQDLTGRPTAGVVNLNLRVLPSSGQGMDTEGDRGFFETALHEVCHVLGISSQAFPDWRDASGVKYKTDELTYTRELDGKSMNILRTPHLNQLMAKRLGVQFFDGNQNWPVGVEIEDAGGSGTAGSHWEERVFYTELMVGTTFGYARISDVTLCALEDTGWYDVDHAKAEPLEWGDFMSIKGATRNTFNNFASGRPVESWPDHYVLKDTSLLVNGQYTGCTFDHRAVGYIQAQKRSCGSSKTNECQYPGFYDPKNNGYYSDYLLDYNLIVRPYSNRICAFSDTPTKNTAPGTYFGPNSMCARTTMGLAVPSYSCFKMECDNYGHVSITVGDETKKCTETGEQLTFELNNYGYVECPDANIVCGILNYSAEFEPMPLPTRSPVPVPDATPPPEHMTLVGEWTYTTTITDVYYSMTLTKTEEPRIDIDGNEVPYVYEGYISLYREEPVEVSFMYYRAVDKPEPADPGFLGLSKNVWIGIGVGAGIVVLFAIIGCCCCSSKKKHKSKHKKKKRPVKV